MENVINYLKNLFNKNDTVIIATSGGPDSMCLLNVVIKLKEEYNLKIICAHVNHNLRKESDDEKIFVENYAVNNNIIFEYLKIDNYPGGKFTEDKARRIRYNFFKDLVKKYNAKYLFTAHHGDDLIETILMRITRGSNLKGYAGINLINQNDEYSTVRPLLYTTKDEILSYLKENNIPYAIDKSNEKMDYTRNRFRKHVLPFLKSEDKNVHLKFLKFNEELNEYNDYINKIVNENYDNVVVDNSVNIIKLKKLDKFIQKKIIEALIVKIQENNIFNINSKELASIMKIIDNEKNVTINLADNYIARKSYNKLYIEKNSEIETFNIELNDIININNFTFEIIKESNEKNNYVLRINSKEIMLPLILRSKTDGDKIFLKNTNGSKKIKDIFIDSKIDPKKRKEYPILIDSNNTILWVPGIKKSKFDKEINEKYDIIIKCTEGKNE